MSGAHRDVQRRTWDVAEYEQRAQERERAERNGRTLRGPSGKADGEGGKAVDKARLDGLERPDMVQYNVEGMVGQRRVVTAENALSEQGGFYCEACDYLMKDHKTYLEHCNKPRHLANMGLPMHMKKAGADDVKARLALHKQLDRDKDTTKDKSALLVKKKREEEKRKREEEEKKLEERYRDDSDGDKDDHDGRDSGDVGSRDRKRESTASVGQKKKGQIKKQVTSESQAGGLDFDPAMFGLPTGFGGSKK